MVVQILRLRLELNLHPEVKISVVKKKRNKKVSDAKKRH